MAHNIDQTVNKGGAFAHVDEGKGSIWHGLGYPIKKGASPEDIATAATLDWPVELRKVRFDIDDDRVGTDHGHQVMYRGDTFQVLDIVGPVYVPHQNLEVLEFFREYVTAGEMYIDTAGSLDGGRHIFVQAKITDPFEIGKGTGDFIQSRVLLMNPHIYGKGMIGKITNTRVVCANTLQLALGESGKSIMIPHIKVFDKVRQAEAKKNLGIARERVASFNADVSKLAKLHLNERALPTFIKIFDGKKGEPIEVQGRTITRLWELYAGAGIGSSMETAKGTGWGALNAVTQYYDHEYGRTTETRVQNAVFGMGDIKKREMMLELLAIAG